MVRGFPAFLGTLWSSRWLIVAAGVDGELAQQLPGRGVDHGDVKVVDQHERVGSGVGSSDADVVQSAGDAQGDAAGLVDAVVPDPRVTVCVSSTSGRGGFRQRQVAGCGGCVVRQGAVRAAVVVFLDELIQQRLQVLDGGWLMLLGLEPVLHRLLEPFDLALGLGVRGGAVLLHDVAGAQFRFEGVAASSAPVAGVLDSEDHAVVGQR